MIETTKALADYADAILAGRRAKNWLFLILLVTLVGELTLFFVSRYTTFLDPTATSTTRPVVMARNWLQYFVALAGFAGLIASVLLTVVLLALTLIMLTVRTLGVGKLTSAFVWSAVLLVLMFPWQAILAGPTISSPGEPIAADFKIPGVIYTWSEFDHPTQGVHFKNDKIEANVLRWARFVGFPAVALVILLAIQVKSGKGVRAALGEDQPPVEAGSGV